jgi:SpoIID/LytB domain protein
MAGVLSGSLLAPRAEGASTLAVCGSGFGHGVGLSQWGAYGRAEAGQSHATILRAYYKGASLKRYPTDPAVRVLLADAPLSGSRGVTVPSGGKARLGSGDAVASLGPGTYAVRLVDGRYRVENVRTGRVYGPYRSPVVFQPVSGLLRAGGKAYRGTMTVRVSGSRLLLVNRLPLERYVRGVVANEMPASWHREALEAQAVAARSYARAMKRSGAFDFYADTRDQVYGGASSETARTNGAVSETARVVATYDGQPITAFFSSSNGGFSEASAYVYSPAPYLKATRDADGSGRPYEARVRSPWTRWTGTLDPDGSPELGVGNVTGARVLERSPSGRVTKMEVTGTRGKKTISGQYEVRRLNQNGLKRADGSTYPAGDLPSARVSFGPACG